MVNTTNDLQEIPKIGKEISDPKKNAHKLCVKMSFPKVHGGRIESFLDLHELIHREYPSLIKRKDFEKRLMEAKVHLDLLDRYSEVKKLIHGEIRQISRVLEINESTIRKWMREGTTPRLYTYMNWSVPVSKARRVVAKLEKLNNGILSSEGLHRKLDMYYFGVNERKSHFYKKEIKLAKVYFKFLQEYNKGGIHRTIAKSVNVPESTGTEWLKGHRPRLVKLASMIPDIAPTSHCKWLPLRAERFGQCHELGDFIEVPETVTNWKQIKMVLDKIPPLENDKMREWRKRYGEFSRFEGFMHLLGTIVSDSNVPSSSTNKIAFGLSQTKRKDWTRSFGEVICYYLGTIGIYAHQVMDTPSGIKTVETKGGKWVFYDPGRYNWISETSTLLRWIRQSCLGFDDSPKTYQKISADWILSAPQKMRAAFLQGLCDGDGGVGSDSAYLSIATISNLEFVKSLIATFGIESSIYNTDVRIFGHESFLKVAKIPPFKHAIGRLETMKLHVERIQSNDWKKRQSSR